MDISEAAREQVTYLFHALDGLDEALAEEKVTWAPPDGSAGCALSGRTKGSSGLVGAVIALALVALGLRPSRWALRADQGPGS